MDLKELNKRIKYHKFKMQSLKSILDFIRLSDLMASIDLKEAYLHIPIRFSHRWFLHFFYAN